MCRVIRLSPTRFRRATARGSGTRHPSLSTAVVPGTKQPVGPCARLLMYQIIGDLSAIHNKPGRQSPFGIGTATDGTVVGAMSPPPLFGSCRATVRPSWCKHVAVKIVGLIGGMSWESSAEYYRLLNEFVREEMGGLHSARCLLYSLDFAEIERLQATGAWKEAEDMLVAAGQSLELAGADFLVLCTNTMHKVADGLEARVSLPLVHIADVVAEAVSATGVTRVGLLGTAFTMEQLFYKDRLATRGIEVIVPSSADRKMVHRIIYEELCVGTIREESARCEPGDHRPFGGCRGRRNRPRLYRARAACPGGRLSGAGVPYDPPPCRRGSQEGSGESGRG